MGMSKHRCLICKYMGDHEAKELYNDYIYRGNGRMLNVRLCYGHSWQLFKRGQYKFIDIYREKFMNILGTEKEAEFVRLMRGEKEERKEFGSWAA